MINVQTWFSARRIELGREPDLDSIDHCGGKWYPLNVTRRSRLMERIEFVTAHPMVNFENFWTFPWTVLWTFQILPNIGLFSFCKNIFSVGSRLFRRLAPSYQTFLNSKNCISNLFIHDDNSWLVQSKVFSNVIFQNVYFESAICMTEISSLPPTQNVSPFDLTDRNRLDLYS